MSEHDDDIAELLGAYALDAVDADERDRIERALAESPRLRAEVDDHREVAALLAYSGQDAPDGVWDRVVGAIEGDASPGPLRFAPVVPLRRKLGAPLIGIAAALVLVIGLVVANGGDSGDGPPELAIQQALSAAAAGAFDDPSARIANLGGPDAPLARAAVLPDGTGFLVSDDLPALGSDRAYQLWGIAGEEVISLGVLGADPEVVSFAAGPDVSVLVLTDEVAGGVAVSQNEPVTLGQLS